MNIQNILSGFVLRPSRSGVGNSETTATATSGVVRHFDEWSNSDQTVLTELFGSQYRCAFIEGGQNSEEYLLWAGNNGRISQSNALVQGVESQLFKEGAVLNKILVINRRGREIESVEVIQFLVGGVITELQKDIHFTWDGTYAHINTTGQTLLTNDYQFLSHQSYLKEMGFYWVKNDTKTRFGWNGEKQTWLPYKGSNIINLGRLIADETYELTPKIGLDIGSFLKGDPSDPTVKATLRLGVLPTEAATVLKVKVVDDDGIEEYDFLSDLDTPDAVVGVNGNKLVFDPNFVVVNIGKFIWYSYDDFQEETDGAMASLLKTLDTPVFLAPIPEYTDRPMLRMGSRTHLTAIACRNETELNALVLPNEKTFAWAESTGRVKFHDDLLQKANPDSNLFDVLYYEDAIIYDGVSHNTQPILFPKATELTLQGEDYFLGDASTTPNGLFQSGFLRVPDGTGLLPNALTAEPFPSSSGLVRRIKTVGDEVFFSSSFATKQLEVVASEKDLRWAWRIKKGTVMVCLENGEVRFNTKDRKNLLESGDGVFFRQGFVTPARTINEASIPSRKSEPYEISAMVFSFEINTTKFVCELNYTETLTAKEAALKMNTYSFSSLGETLLDTGLGLFKAYNGRLYLETADKTGSIKIGFGSKEYGSVLLPYKSRDLSGCAVLGFNAGWVVDTTEDICFLNDSGMAFGLFRSPYNKDLESDGDELDFYSTQKTEGFIGDVRQDFFHHLDQTPLKDMKGFSEGVFFNYREGLNQTDLHHYDDIIYQFDDNRFMWVDESTQVNEVLTETPFISLSPNMVVESSFNSYFNKGIWVSNGSTFNALVKDEDYLILDEGQTGTVAIIEPLGEQIAEGFNGVSVGDELTLDPNQISLVSPKDRVKILGGNLEGSYIVQEVLNSKIKVYPQFAEDLSNLNYQIFSGSHSKSIHADKILYPTSHLPSESFIIRLVELVETSVSGGAFFIDVGDAEKYGRDIFFRVGDLTDDSNDYTPTKIGSQLLGNPRNGVYVIDSPLLEREFIQISFGGGEVSYSKGNGNCHFVNVFSSNTGDYIEIGAWGSPIQGEVRFSDEALNNLGGRAYAVPDISDVTLLGHAEFYYSSREVFVPATQVGKVYLVQRAILGQDVQANPIGGALNFTKPLKKGTVVEARYYRADDDGEKLTEEGVVLPQVFDQLPVFRRQKNLTVTEIDPLTGFFKAEIDLEDDTLIADGEVTLWVGARIQTDEYTFEIDPVTNKLMFDGRTAFIVGNPLYSDVFKASYQVYEADGGEQSYTTSNNPIYRPPFRLREEQDTFLLEGDRTEDFVVGGVIWIDGFLLKIEAANYNSTSTEIVISPAPQKEIGSLSPANDSEMLVSGESLFEDLDFWLDILVSYLPADRGMTELTFEGNLTEVIETNSIIQLGDDVFLVGDTELSDEGDFTLVKLQSPLANGYKPDTHPPKVSVRPIFAENDLEFELGDSVPDTYFELVLFEEGGIGKTLIEDVHYEGSPEEGDIRFLDKFQRGLKKGDVLWVSRTALSALSPFFQNGQVVVPYVRASYLHSTLRTPKGFIEGNYFYSQPDAFFTRVVKNDAYLAEVAKDFSQNMNPNGTNGSGTGFSTTPKNFLKGSLGSRGIYKDTLNQDQAARMFIEVYNRIIVGFEQVRETVTGGFIGDRDGKFKFFVGRDNDLTPKGHENPFTGILNPRNVWEEFFNDTLEELSLTRIPLTIEDAIVQPDGGASRDDYVLKGDDLNMSEIRSFLNEQKSYTRNDIDDIVLVGRKGLSFDWARGFWTKGVYKPMGDNHTVSRLFPERTNMFTRTYAGTLIDGDNPYGVFTNGREIDEEWYSTKGSQIGAISNPVQGTIENISDLDIQKRLARGRVYDYSPTGFPEIESALSITIGERPAVVISVVALNQFPTDSKGIPDTSRMVIGGGEIYDASSGDYDLHTPPFNKGDKVFVGYPNGVIYPTYVYIEEVIAGCVLTFQDEDGNAIMDVADFIRTTFEEIDISFGDSLFIGTDDYMPNAPSDPDLDEQAELKGKSDAYSTWWDFALDRKSGQMIDKSFPSKDDDRFDWQKILSQNPPEPYECLEGVTFFYNGDTQPAKLPCLLGQEKNDSGDYTLPYLKSGETELAVLGQMAKAFDFLFDQDALSNNNAVYPNEVVGRNGVLTSEALLTDSVNFLPVNGSYSLRTGLADVRSYDLLLVEPINSNEQSWQGILSVGSVGSNTIGVPRLVSEQSGLLDKYIVDNAMAHVSTVVDGLGNAENGMVILEDAINNYTTFDLSSQTTFSWEGFISWFNQTVDTAVPEGNRNAARLLLIDHPTGAILSELELHHTLNVGVSVDKKIAQNSSPSIIIDIVDMNTVDPVTYPTPNVVLGVQGIGWFDFALIGTPIGGDDTVFFDFTLGLNAFDDSWGGIGTPLNEEAYTGSFLTTVGADRLKYDLGLGGCASTVRDTVHPNDNSLVLETSLYVGRVEHEYGSDIGDGYPMTYINGTNSINGATPFTFLTEDFTVPSWEGVQNTPLNINGVRFSAMASSDENTTSIICDGEGYVSDGFLAITSDIGNQDTTMVNPYTAIPLTLINGVIENIVEGDVLVIQSLTKTAVTSGSYVIKNVVAPSDPLNPYGEQRTKTGIRFGTQNTLDSGFAKVETHDLTSITLKNIRVRDFFDTGDGNRTCFPSTGSIFVEKETEVYEFVYTSIAEIEVINGFGSCIFTISTVTLDGNPTTMGDVSGITNLKSFGATRFDFMEMLRGYEEVDPTTLMGLEELIITNDTGSQTYTFAGGEFNANATAANKIGVFEAPINTTHGTFSENRVFTEGVPSHIDISEVLPINGEGYIKDGNTFDITQKDLAGIFIEPTTPIPVQDLGEAEPRVVTNSLSMDDTNVGMRSIGDFTVSTAYPNGSDTLAFYEKVKFSVRRVRRWHEIQDKLNEPLHLLPPIYFKRKGSVVSYVSDRSLELSDVYLFGVLGLSGVNRGDTLRILKDGLLIEEHILSGASSFPNKVSIRDEFLTEDLAINPTNYTFEIYLRQGMIPHEQSWDELLDIMTKKVIKTGNDGQCVVRNNLVGADFVGVQEGDLIIIDPHAEGYRPMGDRGVFGRTGFVEGLPSELDDNRGFYRVEENNSTSLKVNPLNEFAGSSDNPVTFGSVGQEYAIYPTMNGTFPTSTPSPDGEDEGQNDLRPTAPYDLVNEWEGYSSLEPFSYKIIRPTGLFSEEMIDLVLTQRERTLSWMEEILEPSRKNKAGSYHIFQLEDHILEIDDPTDTSRGYGLVSNALMESLGGIRNVSPFLNTSDCLSVQDRRYWCGEYNLDYETPLDPALTTPFASFERDGTVLVTGSGRPHLVDRLDDILDSSDRLRNLRYTWISFRTNKSNGTLPSANRARGILEKDLKDEQELINIKKSVENL